MNQQIDTALDTSAVTTLLGLAGIEPSGDEIDTMTRLYSAMKTGADRLWMSEVTPYEPAPIFVPAAD